MSGETGAPEKGVPSVREIIQRLEDVEESVGDIVKRLDGTPDHALEIGLLKRSVSDLQRAEQTLSKIVANKPDYADIDARIDRSWLSELREARNSVPMKQSAMWAGALVLVTILQIIANIMWLHFKGG